MNFAIIGKQCAGKTTVANIILKEFSDPEGFATMLKFAEPHYDMLGILGKSKNRLFMQEISDLCKKHFGISIFTEIFERTFMQARACYQTMVCDDVRYQMEIDKVKALGFITVFVRASDANRRWRSDQQGFVFNDNHNSESEIASLEGQCDFVIENDTSIDDLTGQIGWIFSEIANQRERWGLPLLDVELST